MDIFQSLGVILGGSWASGVNLYMTAAGLGIAHRLHLINLPGDTTVLAHPAIIALAIIMYAVEFVADKVPYFDSFWDSIHTFIRPLAGAFLGYGAMTEFGPFAQTAVALMTGGIAMESHLTKATSRVAINTSPEPVTNIVASATEDSLVFGMLYLIVKHPIIASILVILFIIFAVWFLKIMFRFMKKVFRFLSGGPKTPDEGIPQQEHSELEKPPQ